MLMGDPTEVQGKASTHRPTVSVFVLTYDQEEYIEQTLLGILAQQVDFDIKIVIGDDASSDKTSQICCAYHKRFPKLIDYKRNEVNLGLMGNYMLTAKRLTGKYIAICDGDDYWIDNAKLQKQVDYLESHEDCAILGAYVNKLADGRIIEPKLPTGIERFTIEKMALENRVSAPTCVFRNFDRLNDLPAYFSKFPYGDWPTYLLLLDLNPGSYSAIMSEVTAVYRSDIGVSATMRKNLASFFRRNAQILEQLINDPGIARARNHLRKGLAFQKRAEMMAHQRSYNFILGFKSLFAAQSIDFQWNNFRLYLYSYKRLFKRLK